MSAEQARRTKQIVNEQLSVTTVRMDDMTRQLTELTKLVDFLREAIDGIQSRRGDRDFQHATTEQVEELFKSKISLTKLDRMLDDKPRLKFLR